jgi:transposase
MLYVGIDVAKDKHDCFAMNSDGEILIEKLTITNNLDGFETLYNSLMNFSNSLDNIKVGLEATGHYSNNILNFLTEKGFNIYLINPLQTNLYIKGQSLRKTKTDKLDAHVIATMLISDNLKPYIPVSYHISELKSLTRHRFRLVKENSKFKTSLVRLVDIVFPELPKIVSSVAQKSCLALLYELPSAKDIAECNLTHLTHLLSDNSNKKFNREKAIQIRELARKSIGLNSNSVSLELKQTISIIQFIQEQLDDVEKRIKEILKEINSPILTIPGISFKTAGSILAEIGDVSRFDSPAKLLAFAGLDPSMYQSGKFFSTHSVMVKRGSKYLRFALMTAARMVCLNDVTFNEFKNKKMAEGKHYMVTMGHVAKKLVRVIYYLLKTNNVYQANKVA